jgi:hypothetical protein
VRRTAELARLGSAWLGFGRADFTILWFSFIGLMSDCVKSPTKQVRPAVVHLSAAKTAASARSGRLHNTLGDQRSAQGLVEMVLESLKNILLVMQALNSTPLP